MFRARVVSPSYLGVSVAIATGLAGIFGSTPGAQAQVDLNLQTTVQIFAPPPVEATQATPEAAAARLAAVKPECSFEPAALRATAKAIRKVLYGAQEFQTINIGPQLKEELRTPSGRVEASLSKLQASLIKHQSETCAFQIEWNKKVSAEQAIPLPGPSFKQATKVYVNFPINPTYETDALKTGSNNSPGASAGFGGYMMVSTGVGPERPFDAVSVAAGSASARYPAYPSKSLDTGTEQIAYQIFLDACTDKNVPSTCIYNDTDTKNLPTWTQTPKIITFDTLALEVLNQTAFMPGYSHEIANLLTPQVVLSRQNIDFDSVTGMTCSLSYFCHYANLSLTVGQTFSDVSSQENANVMASAALGWRITEDWSLALQSAATGRHYEQFVGGRDDLLLQSGPVLTFQHTPSPNASNESKEGLAVNNVSFQLPITYNINYSTVSAAAWSGLVVQPTLTVGFSYTVPQAHLE